MLSDPLLFYPAATTTSPVPGAASSFRRVAFGRYMSTTSPHSTDQPARLNIVSQPKTSGPSSFRLRYEVDKNVAAVNGIAQADDTLRLDINFTGNLRSFGEAEYRSALIAAFYIYNVDLSRIMGGES